MDFPVQGISYKPKYIICGPLSPASCAEQAQCIQGLSVLEQILVCGSFLPFYDWMLFHHLFSHSLADRPLANFTFWVPGMMLYGVHIFVWMHVLMSLWFVSRSMWRKTTLSWTFWGPVTPHFTVTHEALVSPHPHQPLFFSFLMLIVAILVGVKDHLTVF
jgi:hypothetical protein